MSSSAPDTSTAAWWGKRRRVYNVGLLLAGLVAFVSYAIIIEKRAVACPGFDITAFTILLQGVGYMVAMCVGCSGQSRRSLRSLSRPALNGSIVSRT